MLPFDINMTDFMLAAKKKADELEKKDKKNRTACSQQALANQLVVGTMPNNPNAQPIQQVPAAQ